jgi:hypothetical protein
MYNVLMLLHEEDDFYFNDFNRSLYYFQNPHLIHATTGVTIVTVTLNPGLNCWQNDKIIKKWGMNVTSVAYTLVCRWKSMNNRVEMDENNLAYFNSLLISKST